MGHAHYFGIQVGLTWSQWLMIPPFIILGFVLFVLIEICISVAMFWTVEGWGINFLRMQFQQLARWPHFIYSYFPRKILTILIPVLLVGSGPVSFIYDVNQYDMLLGLVTAIFVFSLITKTLWRYGLDKYDSQVRKVLKHVKIYQRHHGIISLGPCPLSSNSLKATMSKKTMKKHIYCVQCHFHSGQCFCDQLVPVKSNIRFTIIMHHREYHLTSNTGRLGRNTLQNCDIILRGLEGFTY